MEAYVLGLTVVGSCHSSASAKEVSGGAVTSPVSHPKLVRVTSFSLQKDRRTHFDPPNFPPRHSPRRPALQNFNHDFQRSPDAVAHDELYPPPPQPQHERSEKSAPNHRPATRLAARQGGARFRTRRRELRVRTTRLAVCPTCRSEHPGGGGELRCRPRQNYRGRELLQR